MLEITAISWSPDSQKIASSSLSEKVSIRNLKEPIESKMVTCGVRVLALVWDPLDKYLVALNGENNVIVIINFVNQFIGMEYRNLGNP